MTVSRRPQVIIINALSFMIRLIYSTTILVAVHKLINVRSIDLFRKGLNLLVE